MKLFRCTAGLAALALAGCASPDSLEGQRTVFNNPYAVPVIDRTGVGPKCDEARGDDATCLGVPLTRKGRGSAIGERNYRSFTKNQRRILRERAELLREVAQQSKAETPPAPPQPAPPIMARESERSADVETDKP
ncbi:hypothetical protein [Porphyrobacter sp. YT40]|uniref:hypothetical protein n=1 Tax=Porphyrobacter sp. YT40 TaxID=2547601 RepID=UPI00114477F3|nr:hypothetical protein [Porphyrobacter sp. YT40]QDH35315.1 hypothetical protein E2E27_13905 [Porphyrobacter sp. YT40]